jgi:hypothetical protein
MTNSYRSTLEDLARIDHYEREVFSLGSYASLLRTIERWYLENFLQHAPLSASGVLGRAMCERGSRKKVAEHG